MFKFLHHLLNPHCPDCLIEREKKIHCESCDVRQYEIERLRAENARLLDRILEKPTDPPVNIVAPIPQSLPRPMTWAMRRQMLEAEDRERAKIMKQAPQPSDTTDALEQEVLNAEMNREANNGPAR